MNDNKYPVLMYHNVHPDTSLISISPEIFSQQMQWLKNHGYNAAVLSLLINHLHSGHEIPEKTVFLTFDDGFAGLYQYVNPILQKYDYSATIFLVSGYCGQTNDWPGQLSNIPRMPLLNWDQIREMDDYGIEFGSHSLSHPMLDDIDEDELINEIQGSKTLIEKNLGHKIESFAYPYGRYNELVKRSVEGEFFGACSTNIGYANSRTDPYLIERIDINLVNDLWIFRRFGSTIFDEYLSSRRILRKLSTVIFNRQYW